MAPAPLEQADVMSVRYASELENSAILFRMLMPTSRHTHTLPLVPGAHALYHVHGAMRFISFEWSPTAILLRQLFRAPLSLGRQSFESSVSVDAPCFPETRRGISPVADNGIREGSTAPCSRLPARKCGLVLLPGLPRESSEGAFGVAFGRYVCTACLTDPAFD